MPYLQQVSRQLPREKALSCKGLPKVSADSEVKKINGHANAIAARLEADVILFNGGIERPSDRRLVECCKKRRRRSNVMVLLVTDGGDADAAYRISRCFQDNYKKFIIYVTGTCKSAGTIVALGANEVVMSDLGELGPLDVQLRKVDELWEMSSGLTVMNALSTLQSKSFSMFEKYFLDLKSKSGGQITLKTATEIASNLTTGLFGRIYSQIDPTRLGEISRAMNIGKDYGVRLGRKGNNLKDDAIVRLTAGFPSHSFVIDRAEAESLFNVVRVPTDDESMLAESLGELACSQLLEGGPFINFLSTELPEPKGASDGGKNGTKKKADAGEHNAPEGRGAVTTAGGPGSEPADGIGNGSNTRSQAVPQKGKR